MSSKTVDKFFGKGKVTCCGGAFPEVWKRFPNISFVKPLKTKVPTTAVARKGLNPSR